MSILEVMISVGIAALGLFGVLALLPLAGGLALQGLNEDNKAAVGRSAVEALEIHGMRNPNNWLRWAGNFPTPQFVPVLWHPGPDGGWGNAAVDDDSDGTPDDPTNLQIEVDEAGWPGSDDVPTATPVVPQAFCIDPRFVARNLSALATTPRLRRFPSYLTLPPLAPSVVSMERITLRSAPGASAMSQALADAIFQTGDDLIFRTPKDKTLPPVPEFVRDSSNTPLKRQSEGRMSWMATLVPEPRGLPGLYRLSIVVFYQRVLDAAATPPNERVCLVTLAGGGIGGGGAVLTATKPAVKTDQGRIADLDIAEGDWLMLAGVTGSGTAVFRWYRVAARDPQVLANFPAAGQFSRHVTLQGPDWDAASIPNPQATITPGVVAVYERTIRLENNTLWSN